MNRIKIGIGVSTTSNRDILPHTLRQFDKYMPDNALLVVDNDKDFTGVAATKNRLLSNLDKYDYIFLFDDDCYPISGDWWRPYVESDQNHLIYQFKLPNKTKKDMQEVYRDDKHVAYTHTRGAMLYIKRIVLDYAGGMDERYGEGYYEHTDWTNRIHNLGLTKFRGMDVVGSEKLFYCLDQDGKVRSSISDSVKNRNKMKNRCLYQKSLKSKEYMEYRNGK